MRTNTATLSTISAGVRNAVGVASRRACEKLRSDSALAARGMAAVGIGGGDIGGGDIGRGDIGGGGSGGGGIGGGGIGGGGGPIATSSDRGTHRCAATLHAT